MNPGPAGAALMNGAVRGDAEVGFRGLGGVPLRGATRGFGGAGPGSLISFGGMRRLPRTVTWDCYTLPTAVSECSMRRRSPARGPFLRRLHGDETKFPEDYGCRE